MSLDQPRTYTVRLYHGDRSAPVDPALVVLDFSPGEPAAAARAELDALGEQLRDAAVIRPSETDLCWLHLEDVVTAESRTWRLGRRSR